MIDFSDLQKEFKDLVENHGPKNLQDEDFFIIGEMLIYKYGFEVRNDFMFKVVAKYLRRCMSKKITRIKSRCTHGLILSGGVGVGKSFACEIIAKECDFSFGKILDYNESEKVKFNEKVSNLDIFGAPHEAIFDDVGTEPESVKNFGTLVELFQEIVDLRYRIWKSEGIISIFNTNLTKEEVQNRYGDRTFDRLSEMCHFVSINGRSQREKT